MIGLNPESKRVFANRQGNGDWKKDFEQDVMDAKFAGLATGKGWDTDYSKSLMEKVNAQAGVEAAKAGGMKAIGIGEDTVLGRADKVIPNFVGIKSTDLLLF